jgi:hypothetical protein
VGQGTFTEMVFELIDASEREGWTDKLVVSAREFNPGNPSLTAFAQLIGLAPSTPLELERIIRQNKGFLDVDAWLARVGRIEAQVCRVEIPLPGGASTNYGTGFLVAPDVVITNYHVAEPLIDGSALTDDAILRFDYKRTADGSTVQQGTEVRLTTDWLIDKSPPSAMDGLPDPKSGAPKEDELDYALIRLARALGQEPIGGGAAPNAPPRGWIEVPDKAYGFPTNSTLFIVQHPDAEPIKIAQDEDAVIGLNENGTRVRYRTNTLPGSSGSPCFNIDWLLVALHHSGDSNYALGHQPEYNEGIPFSAIRQLLQHRGLVSILGGP